MRQISKLTNNGRQSMNLVGDNGEIIPFALTFMPTQNSWYFNISYQDFVLNGALLTVSPNILRGYRNLIPFGLMCTTTDNYEVQFLNDFIDARTNLYLLNATEVAQIEAQLYI